MLEGSSPKDVAVAHPLERKGLFDKVSRVDQYDVPVTEQFHNELELSFFCSGFEDHYAFKLVLTDLDYDTVPQVFAESHTEGWRLLRFFHEVGG